MAPRLRRHAGILAVLATVAIAAACVPVTPPPAPKPKPTVPTTTKPKATTCAEPAEPLQSDDGKTEYFAVVDDGTGPTEAVSFDAATETEKVADVAQIEATDGDVIAVEPDYPVEVQLVDPNDDPEYGNQWGIDAAHFVTAWDASHAPTAGAGVIVAVLDTGVRATHQDLMPAVVSGTDRYDGSTDGTSDPNGHGTHVAGILGMQDNNLGGIGGAPGATIFPVRVLGPNGSGSYSAVINGINDAINNNAKVISMSLGGPEYSQALQNAVTNAISAGIVVVAAAGNAGNCNAVYPAGLSGVIAVASTDNPGSSLSSFSSRGPSVDIAAPGGIIDSTLNNNTYGYKSGTSMATPFVAAAAALLKGKCGLAYPPSQIEAKLQSTTAPKIANIEANSGALRADLATASC